MTTWQFWTLAALLGLILLALLGIRTALGDLWTKLHEVQSNINHLPAVLGSRDEQH